MKAFHDAICEADLIDDDKDSDPEPTCAECKCSLYTENHEWDCSYGDDDENMVIG